MLLQPTKSVSAAVDPFYLVNGGPLKSYYKLSGRTLVDPRIDPGEETLVIVTLGQSLITNHVEGSYSCTEKVHNLCLDNGGVYEAVQPLVGCSLTTVAGRESNYAMHLADKLIQANEAERVILCPIGIGGTNVTQWAPGGACNERIGVIAARLAAKGYVPDAICWHQGDGGLDTQAAYEAALGGVIQTFRNHGVMSPFIVAQATYNAGVTSSAIRAAQLAVVDNVSIFQGPDIDTLNSSYRVDNLHLNQLGADAAAALWVPKIQAVL